MSKQPGRTLRVLLEVEVEAAITKSGKKTTNSVNWIFPNESLIVGRSPAQAKLVIANDSAMSKRHFQIEFDGQTCVLTDLKSANGTRVNGRLVEAPVELHDGDEICAGTTIFGVGFLGDQEEVQEEVEPTEADTVEPVAVAAPSASQPRSNPPVNPRFAAAQNNIPDDEQTIAIPAPKNHIPDDEQTIAIPGGSRPVRVVALRLKSETIPANSHASVDRMMAWVRSGQRLSVGSSTYHADWAVPADWGLSDLQFELSFDGRRCILHNQNTIQPTTVNGEPVSEAEVADGDTVTAGSISFVVQIQ